MADLHGTRGNLRALVCSLTPARIRVAPRTINGEKRAGERPGRYLTLEIGRGIAATMVALSHAVSLIAEPR